MEKSLRYGALSTALFCATAAHAVNINDPYLTSHFSGDLTKFFDSANAWPGVASLTFFKDGGGGGCTGALINARTILTAAHCLPNMTSGQVKFSNDPQNVATANDRILSGALGHKSYNGATAYDLALVTVRQPVTALTPMRLAVPADFADPTKLVGREVTIVGYGQSGTGTRPGDPLTRIDPATGLKVPITTQLTGWDDNKRRVVVTNIASIAREEDNDPTRILSARFRNPLLDKTAPALQGQPESGDSGGPLLINEGGKWIVIGTVKGGDSGYGATDTWTWIADHVDWLTKNNPLQSVTSKAGTHQWSAPGAWSTGEVPNNSDGKISGEKNSTLGRYFDVNVNTETTLAVNVSPTVDTLTIDHPNAQVSVLAGQTLTSVLDTTINRGNVDVAGVLKAGNDDVASRIVIAGGLVAGSGTLFATNRVLQTGGVIAPGSVDKAGVLSVNGKFEQQGGTLLARLGNTSASLLSVTGSATLGGKLLVSDIRGENPTFSSPYAVLKSQALTGKFSTVATTLAFVTPTASYGPQNVEVTLNPNGKPLETVAGDPSDEGAAKALDKLPVSNPVVQQLLKNARISSGQTDSDTKAMIVEVTGSAGAAQAYLDDAEAQTDLALSSLAGEGLVAAQNLAFSNAALFVEGIRQQSQNWLIGFPMANAVAVDKTGTTDQASRAGKAAGSSAWVNVQGGAAFQRGDGNYYGINSSGVNVQLGVNHPINNSAMVGVALGGSNSTYSVSDLSTSGNLSTINLGIYGIARHEALYAAGTLAYARNSATTNRTVTVFDLYDKQKASFNIDTLSARLEVGYRAETPVVNVTPFAAIEPTWLWQSAFSESQQRGGNSDVSLGLNVRAQQTTSLPASLGLQFDRRIDLENGWTISPVVRAAWIREFMPQRNINAEFQMSPGESFTSAGLSAAANVAQFSLGLLVSDNKAVSSYVSGTAYASDRGQAWQAQLSVNIRF